MNKFSVLAVAVSVGLSGCAAAPPNTPGAGSGDTYTPFVDVQGVDPARYSADLASCRSYAQQIDPNKQAMQGMLAGIIVGALVGAAVGGSGRHAEYGAGYGGTVGVMSGGGRAVLKQETIIANCLAGRGYRVLEGATVGTNPSAPSPYTYGAAPVVAPTQIPVVTPVVATPVPVAGVAPYSGIIQPTVTPRPVSEPVGQDSGNVERIAKGQACHTDPKARLTAKGPGFETYAVACSNGDSWTYRCEFGNCRKLQ